MDLRLRDRRFYQALDLGVVKFREPGKRMHGVSSKGFSVLELVFVLFLIGVLSLVKLYFLDPLETDMDKSWEQASASQVQIGLVTYFSDPRRGNFKKVPPELDGAVRGSCSEKNPCFTSVLPEGMQKGWKKISPFEYSGPGSPTSVWRYEPDKLAFYKVRE